MHAIQMMDTMAMFQRGQTLCDVLLLAQPEGEAAAAAGEAAGETRGTWAHRTVLAAGSPYFLAMFTNFSESSEKVVTIKDVEESALRAVVEYIYSPSSLSVTVDNAQALLSAASLLGVDGVRDAVCKFLERALAADNALGIRAFAELHACVALAATATSYVNTHFEHVLQADELLALAPDALATLLESLAVPAEERVLDAVLRWTQQRPQERQQHLFELLRHVRLPLLSPEELTKRAHAEPLVTAEIRVQRQLIDALSFHQLSSERRALSAAGSEWYRPRQHRAADSGPHALLVVGSSDVLSFELSSGCWQSAVALPAARGYAGVAVLDGRVYVVGGHDGDTAVNTVFVYDVARGSWSSGPSLTTSRLYLAAATLDGMLYAVGGQESRGAVLSSAEAFDPREGVWRSIASMSTARAGLGVAALDGRVYAVGGENNNGSLNTVERYDPSSARWETVDSMSERRTGAAVCVVDDVLYAAGGWNGSTTVSSVERYRDGSGWEPAPSMITARHYAAVATHDGRLYVRDGRNMSPKDGRSEARESHSTDEVDIRARHLSAMLASLAALQRSAALCDVLLQVEPESATSEAAREAAGTGVWAHRAVLGAASPYFHNIFENSDQQCKRLVIMVPRVTSKILRLLVDNVYTPTSLSVTVEEGKSLLAAATHLTVADVRDEATTCLARSLAVDNVLGIYVTAESNDCPALTALAANFMQKNGEHVLQVDELLSLQPSMLGELLAGGRLAAPAQSALKAVLRWTMHRPQERRQHLSSLLEVVQLPQVPRPLLFEITRKEPIVNNAYALRLIILACLTDTDHDTQESTKNKKKSSRRVESELAFSRTSSEHRPVVSTDHAPLAVGDCNKNADVIPDVSSFEHRAVVSTAHAPLAVGDCNKNADIIPDESSSEHRAVISTAHASLAVGICNKSAKIIPDVSSSEHRAVVSTAHTPLAVGDCNKNADIIPDVSSSEHRAVVSTAHAPLAVGVCNKSAKIIPDVSSSEHRAAVSTAHASLAVGDYNKNAEIIPNMTSELSSGSRQSTALLSAARTAAGAAMLDDNVFKGTKNEQKSDRIVDNELAISTSSDHRAAVSAPHALLVMGGHKKGTKCTADVLSFELSSGRWQSAATLPETRAEAGIALLDGRVYVIGGLHDRERLNTVVVYDVARGSWSSGPSLSMARCQLAAAALDGVLYAIGGRDAGSRFLRTVEAFDPREGVWRTIANMPTERSALGVAGLHGRLYAAGGENFTGKLDRVERYDPSSAKWERVDCMARSRCNVAVGVVDDALYAVGGYDNWTTHDTVERYRVASGWERAPSMIMERWGAAVASHSGRLYVAGGRNHWNVILSSVEVFSPSSAAWRELPNMPEGRVAASAVVVHWQPHGTKNEQKSSRSVDNKQQQHLSNAESPESGMSPVLRQTFDERCEESSALLVVGGYKKSTGCTADVLSYKPSSHRWQSAAALPAARGGAGVAVLDGRVYVVGGHNGDSAVNTVFVYDVARGSWSSGPSLITSRWQLAAATLDGVLYAVGGQDSGDTHLSSAEAFDPREGVWRSIASMSTGRAGLGVATMQGRLYAVGGENGTGALNSVDRYNPSSAMWEPVHRMSERRSGVAVCVMNRAIYAAGGWNGSTTHRSVERYRAGSGWKPAPSMITARWGATMASHDGRLYVAGGFNDRDDFLSSVEVFSSLTTSWSELRAAMPTGRSFAAAVVVHWPPTDP